MDFQKIGLLKKKRKNKNKENKNENENKKKKKAQKKGIINKLKDFTIFKKQEIQEVKDQVKSRI